MANNFPTTNRLVSLHLGLMIKEVEKTYNADCLCYIGPITFGVDDIIRDAIEALSSHTPKKKKLLVILETFGGYAETARRISDTLRHHYTVVDYLIPSHAMSAGTILAMSGDAIHMDYYSVLGPIDPQIEDPNGNSFIPALGYLARYQDLLDKAKNGAISTAEMKILLNFDQGKLYAYEQARQLSLSLLEEWLVKYKFKNWKITSGTKTPVTLAMKRKRANEIAEKLNDTSRWNSHGIGINMDRLRKELNLKIDDFGETVEVSYTVRRYHGLLSDFMARNKHRSVVHTRNGYDPLM